MQDVLTAAEKSPLDRGEIKCADTDVAPEL